MFHPINKMWKYVLIASPAREDENGHAKEKTRTTHNKVQDYTNNYSRIISWHKLLIGLKELSEHWLKGDSNNGLFALSICVPSSFDPPRFPGSDADEKGEDSFFDNLHKQKKTNKSTHGEAWEEDEDARRRSTWKEFPKVSFVDCAECGGRLQHMFRPPAARLGELTEFRIPPHRYLMGVGWLKSSSTVTEP